KRVTGWMRGFHHLGHFFIDPSTQLIQDSLWVIAWSDTNAGREAAGLGDHIGRQSALDHAGIKGRDRIFREKFAILGGDVLLEILVEFLDNLNDAPHIGNRVQPSIWQATMSALAMHNDIEGPKPLMSGKDLKA